MPFTGAIFKGEATRNMLYATAMHLDVMDLAAFYNTTLGQVARRILRQRIRDVWPDTRGMSVMGWGFASPYLRPFMGEAARVIAAMPSGQGAMAWPTQGPHHTVLVEDCDLPFTDSSLDRILVIHGLEMAEPARPLLREIWRVLTPGGRVLIVAPNRRSLWAQSEANPFGHGRPYTRGQLIHLLRDQMFTPLTLDAALHIWPVRQKWLLRWAMAIERMGTRWLSGFAGVHLIEASKQIYALTPGARLSPARRQRALATGSLSRDAPRNLRVPQDKT